MKGNRKRRIKTGLIIASRNYGKYFRTFALPNKIKQDSINAEFKDGQLTITVPKSEEAKPKEIAIKVQ